MHVMESGRDLERREIVEKQLGLIAKNERSCQRVGSPRATRLQVPQTWLTYDDEKN